MYQSGVTITDAFVAVSKGHYLLAVIPRGRMFFREVSLGVSGLGLSAHTVVPTLN